MARGRTPARPPLEDDPARVTGSASPAAAERLLTSTQHPACDDQDVHSEARRARTAPSPGRPPAAPDVATPAGHPIPLFVVATLVLLIGFGLGWMGRWTDAGAFRGSAEFARLGGPWLVAAHVAGAIAAWRRGPSALLLGAVAGATAISLGSLTYYGLSVWLADGFGAERAFRLGVGWGAAGLVIGGAVGMLGAVVSVRWNPQVRAWLQGASVGALGGLLVGEAIALLWVWDSSALRTMAMLEALAGAGLVAVAALGRSWQWIVAAVLAAGVTASLAPVAATLVRETLRTIGWAGA